MKTKKAVLILFTLFLVFTTLLAACDPGADESKEESVVSQTSVNSNDDSDIKESEDASSSTSSDEESPAPIVNEETEYLNVLGCTLTDKNCFVVVGQCEVGATITATTKTQNVTATTDSGFYSVRLKKESAKTRVTIVAQGTITEQYMIDAKPKVPTSDMWPIVGGDGYNFFFQKMMPDFEQNNKLTSGQISSVTSKIQDRVAALENASPNTEIIYMIVPSKATIYPELVPSDYTAGTGESRLDQVSAALEAGGATVIDLKDAFTEHKNDEYKLYWRTDSHWTDYGAFVAYTELFNYIKEEFPAAAPRDISDFNFEENFYNGGDMIYYMMMDQDKAREYCYYRTPKFNMDSDIASVSRYRAANYLMYNNEVVPDRIFNTNRSNLPDIYVLRDSYHTQMYDILAERANVSVYKSMWGYTYNLSDISEYAPDYVIYLVAEWNIDSILQS